MATDSISTESKILAAAKDQFIRNGLDGTSMQSIADAAGINKSLLHYYYRTKQNLFEAVFRYAIKKFVPRVLDSMITGKTIFERVRMIISQYLDMLDENPFIPMFVLHEIHRNPQRPAEILMSAGLDVQFTFKNLIREER
jgi:AcrR family transcriptional regulator